MSRVKELFEKKSTDLGQCCVCFSSITVGSSQITCLGLRACCYHFPYRGPDWKFCNDPEIEKKHKKIKKQFLAGNIYPEISVWHKSEDGCETANRINNNKFFKV